MYPPKHHKNTDRQKMLEVIDNYPLATLVSVLNEKPMVTHLPVLYNRDSNRLVAHIDKKNPQVQTLQNGAEVTVVFRGPDAYISPSIYTTPQLPTWNYIVVHLTGKVTLINEPEAAKETMVAMTRFLEGESQKFTLLKEDERMDALINYIQAFEVDVTSWESIFKLSQDKNHQDQHNAKKALKKNKKRNRDGFIDDLYN